MVLGLKGQRSRSQLYTVQKRIDGNQVAGMSYALYRVPCLLLLLFITRYY